MTTIAFYLCVFGGILIVAGLLMCVLGGTMLR